MQCPFCQIPPERIIAQNEHAFAIRDAFPVSPGHTLIIPKRHVGSFFDTTQEEKDHGQGKGQGSALAAFPVKCPCF
jgi:diadenosine tetraphosphate (Ap4A) HIT family hydrolase